MNKEKFLELADFFENLDESRFNLGYWFGEVVAHQKGSGVIPSTSFDVNDCKTVACVAGWTVVLENGGNFSVSDYHNGVVSNKAAEILDLNSYEAATLFYVDSDSVWAKYAPELGINYYFEDGLRIIDDPSEVTPRDVSFIMRKIASGEIDLSNLDEEKDD
jgi:hypothetical protein